MKKQFTVLIMLMLGIFSFSELMAQQRAVRGKVTSAEDGGAIPGVNVIIQGTTTGTVTDMQGEYQINVPQNADSLSFSSIGFETQVVEVGDRSVINVTMQPELKQLTEVVVTAFGIEREEKSLSYAVSQIDASELAKAREVNVANSLAGRVAGVQVGSSSGGPTSASQVIIRGNSSLAGNNQPLYVIDGIPMDNQNHGSAGRWGGIDRGDGIGNINPDDIKNISVLKGPNASALYGQRGANGVVLITTKSGAKRDGIGVNFSSNFQVGNPLVLPDFQNVYGQGNGGNFTFFRRDSDGQTFTREDAMAQDPSLSGFTPQLSNKNDGVEGPVSYGASMDGQQAYTWDGRLLPYSPQPDNVRDFFETQKTFTNTISLNGGNDQTTFYFSASNMELRGMLPNNEQSRNTLNLRGTHKVTDKISVDVKANYINQKTQQRPQMSDGQQNVAYLFRYMPRNLRIEEQKNYEWSEAEADPSNTDLFGTGANPVHINPAQVQPGWTRHWSDGTFTEQPYWAVNNVHNEDTRDRLIGMARVNYDITDWLSLSARTGTDTYTDHWYEYRQIGTRVRPEGDMRERTIRVRENNSDILLTFKNNITQDFYLEVNAGGQSTSLFRRTNGFGGRGFNVPGLHVINNINNDARRTTFNLSESKIQSVYAFSQLAWKNMLFLDLTARNDWSSTLNPDNNSFFYPSISGAFVFTDAFEIPADILSFGKVRGSWAQAGNSGDPYSIFGTYSFPVAHVGRPLASYQNRIPFFDLKNELTTSIEFGLDLRFFNGRAGVDVTYYDASTENQILGVNVSPATGYTSKLVNAGEIRNYGLEMMLTGTPVSTTNFSWDISFNFARNRSEVISLVEGVDRFQLGVDRNVQVFAEPGQPYGQIWSIQNNWLRDENGNRLIDTDGLPIREIGAKPIGNALPNWLGGLTNAFSYRNFSLNSLIDIRQGGQIFSMSNVYEAHHGTTNNTVVGRDGTLVLDGVKAEQNDAGEWVSTGQPNDIQTDAETYWRDRVVPGSTNAVTEEFLNDASFIAIRELSLSYRLPNNLLGRTFIRTTTVSLVGRNLGYLQRYTDGFSPESSAYNVSTSSGGALGLESASFPMARTFGIDLNIGL